MGLLLALRSGVPLLPHAGAQPATSRTLQFIERHVGQRIVIRAATMMWTARRERGREGACGDWAGAAFWTEFARRGSLAAIAVCLNTRGAWSGEGKTVSQADVCCTHTCKPLDMWIRVLLGPAGSFRGSLSLS